MIRDLEKNQIGLQEGANRHCLLLGKSGCGKTWSCYRMLEATLDQGKTCLVFDYSGSFTSKELIKGDFQKMEQTYSVAEKEENEIFLYAGTQLSSVMAEALMKVLSIGEYRQKNLLKKALGNLACNKADITITGIMSELEDSVPLKNKDAEKQRDQLLSKLSGYSGINLVFREISLMTAEMKTYWKPMTIIQLSRYRDSERWFLTALLTELVWHEIKEGTYHADYIVYDEFQWMPLGNRSALSGMLREGRKYGLGVWLASQFLPAGKKDEKNTLLQVDTVLMFAQSEQSRTEAAKTIEYDAWREWVSPLSDLEIGEFVLKGHYTVNGGTTVWSKPIICKAELK